MSSRTWSKIPRLLTLSLIVCWTSPLLSQSRPVPIQRAKVKKGDRAPFAGHLLTPAALAKIITDYEKQIADLKLELAREQRERKVESDSAKVTCKAQVEGKQAQLEAFKGGADRERAIWKQALEDRSRPDPWYRSPYLHFIIGSVVAGGICVGAGYAK